jgi:hypothetical protein
MMAVCMIGYDNYAILYLLQLVVMFFTFSAEIYRSKPCVVNSKGPKLFWVSLYVVFRFAVPCVGRLHEPDERSDRNMQPVGRCEICSFPAQAEPYSLLLSLHAAGIQCGAFGRYVRETTNCMKILPAQQTTLEVDE